jgi:hypothetical protein
MEFMPEHAPLSVLAFLGTTFLEGLATLVLLVALWKKKKWIASGAAAFAAVLFSAYFMLLLGVSLTSHEKLLAPGERKYFCEIDCHIAYSVVSVEETGALGDESHQTRAAGRFVIVRLKTWFDPSTISPNRGNGELAPNPRRLLLVDDLGNNIPPATQAQAALAHLRGATTPLVQPLRPGDSYVTDLVFDVPSNARNPRLFVGDDFDLPDRLLIGHEDSYLHKKIYLGLSLHQEISAGRVH